MSYESKDELYNDNDMFYRELERSFDKGYEKIVFAVEITDVNFNELVLIWQFREDLENWNFGIQWVLVNIKERIAMKHVVKMVAYIDTEETDLVKLGELGLQKIKEEIESGVCVVDVFLNCVKVEMVCVNIKDKEAIEYMKKKTEGEKNASKQS